MIDNGSFSLNGLYGGYWNGTVKYTIDYTVLTADSIRINSLNYQVQDSPQSVSGSGFYNSIGFVVPTASTLPPTDPTNALPEPQPALDNMMNGYVKSPTYGIYTMIWKSDLADTTSRRSDDFSKLPFTATRDPQDGKFHLMKAITGNRQEGGGNSGHRNWFYDNESDVIIQTYTPMAIRKSGSWRSLDNLKSGAAAIRQGTKWNNFPKQDYATNKIPKAGTSRIRHSNQFIQQSKVGN